MQLDTEYKATSFDRLSDGDLFIGFIGNLSTGHVVHAVKAFWRVQGEDPPEPCFVTVGPFGGERPGPTVFRPQALRDGSVLRLTGDVRLRPSLDVGDLQPAKGCSDDDLISKVLVNEGGTFLGAEQGQGPGWVAVFLDVATGEVMRSRPESRAMVSSRWGLVMKRDGEAPVTLFEWP